MYGPTEATVTATWTVVHPDRPVTIGVPLPTYSVVVLDPDCGPALPPGAMGEIGIAGIGLASGYLNRPTSPSARSCPTSSASRTTRPAGSTGPATWAG